MRPKIGPTLVVILLFGSSPAVAQEETPQGLIPVGGGLYVPAPSRAPGEVEMLAPPSGRQQTESEGSSTIRGRETGRTQVGEDGIETQVYQSSRITTVSESTSRDRFNWFYDAEEVYTGVIPQVRDSLPHIERHQRRGEMSSQSNRVTWIGFQPLSGYTRVFVQLARSPRYEVQEHEDGAAISVTFDNTRLSLRNFSRFIDTSHFGRSIDLIDAENLSGGDARLIIWRNHQASYEVSVEGDYLYVDFQDASGR